MEERTMRRRRVCGSGAHASRTCDRTPRKTPADHVHLVLEDEDWADDLLAASTRENHIQPELKCAAH
jgi:hypothetical protein